jgi:oligoribonuclease
MKNMVSGVQPSTTAGHLVWIDLEMTGLDTSNDVILEIAVVITNNNLEVIAEGPSLVIHHDDAVLNNMNDWCKKQHGVSGLTKAVQESTVSLARAKDAVREFIMQHVPAQKGILCGNSVWQDALFLKHYMPEVTDYLFYRIIDVSSIKEVLQRWYPNNNKKIYIKPETHRAMEDVYASIAELKHYRMNFFVPTSKNI